MIKHPKRFKEAIPANFNGIFDWDFLLPAFTGTKIEPTDIDGVVERHGRFLLFETKAPDKVIPDGQRIMLEALLKIGKGTIHLIVIYGKTKDSIVSMEEWYYHKGKVKKKLTVCDFEYILERVANWFKWANKEEH